MTNEDLHRRIESDFTYHAPDDDDRRLHAMIRNELRDVAHELVDLLPECRERSLAITNLEQTMMWANAAIARSDNVPKFTNAPPINAPEDVITQANTASGERRSTTTDTPRHGLIR